MIKTITKYQNNSNEDGATLSIWYAIEYECGRFREFKHLPKSGEKFMKAATAKFWSWHNPKGYMDSNGVERGNPEATCDYGYTQHCTVYAQ